VSSLKVCDRVANFFNTFIYRLRLLTHWTALSHTVKIIMDRISKRSKGYAFVEYTTEEAGGAALKAMNGQVGD
jgi:RNA recognition motif-containing protein